MPTAPRGTPALTRDDLEPFIDAIARQQLKQGDIGGMVVSVVKGGQVVFMKGYGYADVKKKTPVSADSTLFRIGSISKTFTWTAVMQLVEQGKIDLDRDVNDYIDFKIPATFGKPLTMKHLLTHTPGFEEVIKDLFVADSSQIVPLKRWLPTHLPKQIYPPGTTPAYSNYGATLAGYIVERVSGEPFDDYIDRHILQPLQMPSSTFRQPLPVALKPRMSQGYQKASDSAKAFEIVAAWPAGSVAATAENMNHWMIAHLHDGAYGDAHILKPETAREMHAQLFTVLPTLPGMAHGFYEEPRNGHRIVGHGGDTQWFHSDMHLLLDDDVGFFVSYNSAGNGKGTGRTELFHAFMDRYFPYAPPAAQPVATQLTDAKSVTGSYRSSRRAQTTWLSALDAASQATVSVNGDSTISVTGEDDLAGNPRHYREVGPLFFRAVDGQELVAFTKDFAGDRMMATELPIFVAQHASLLKNGKFNSTLAGLGVAMFVFTLLFWPITAMLRRHYGARPELDPRYLRLRRLVRIASVINLACLALLGRQINNVSSDIGAFTERGDPMLRIIQLLALLGVIGAVAAIALAVRSWRTSGLWTWTRVWNTLVAIGFAGFAFVILNWHLLQATLRY